MAYELPPTFAARPRRRLRTALVGVSITLTVCGVGAAGLSAWTFQSIRRANGPARQAADAFLHDLTADDLDGAYRRLCARTRDRMSRPVFGDWAHAQPKVDRYEISDVTVTVDNGGLKGTVTAKLTWESGVVASQALPLETERGDWRVCGNPV